MPGWKVTVGVCGGVAAYRAVELVRALQEAGLDPHVVMTRGAKRFVQPLTFAAVSGHRVITGLWSGGAVPDAREERAADSAGAGWSSVEHIEQAQTTGALVIVPATANILGKLAHGIADDFLTTMYTATEAPVVIAPAMNVVMWRHPAVRENVRLLRQRGARIVEPGAGYLACGMEGTGRLATLGKIVQAVESALRERGRPRDLAGEVALVTAGGTREPIDAVRFLGNRSSGRMGYALAAEALARGARVHLVTAATALPAPPGAEVHQVSTAAEMRVAVLGLLPRVTLVLKAAAVSDFRVVRPVAGKIERDGTLELKLEPTADIVAEVVRRRRPGTIVIAFAAEMSLDLERARAKLERKGVDAIVLNDISEPGRGFDAPRNAGTILGRDGSTIELPEMGKRGMARRILAEAVRLRTQIALPIDA